MKKLFLTHIEFNLFKSLVTSKLCFDLGITNVIGVEILYTDNTANNEIVSSIGF